MTASFSYASSFIAVFALFLAFSGCKQGEQASASSGPVPEDLKIMFGQSGIYAGRMMGYSITADGAVMRWEGKSPEETSQGEATLEAAQVRQLWEHADAIKVLEMKQQAMANAAWFVTITADGESRRVTWTEQDPEAPVQQFYQACMEMAKAALEKKGGQDR